MAEDIARNGSLIYESQSRLYDRHDEYYEVVVSRIERLIPLKKAIYQTIQKNITDPRTSGVIEEINDMVKNLIETIEPLPPAHKLMIRMKYPDYDQLIQQ